MMKTSPYRWLLLSAAAALVALGCSDDGEYETTGTTGSSGAGASGSTTNASSSSASTSGSGGSGGGACFDPGGGGYGGFGNVCMEEADDSDCLSCVRGNCCKQVTACEDDANCSCLLQCFLDNCDPVECLQLCGQSDEVDAVTVCAAGSCGNQCIGS